MGAKIGKSTNGNAMHYSVGAIIKRDGKYLIVDRATPPLGYAFISCHLEENETLAEALSWEVEHENGMRVIKSTLLYDGEVESNWCNRGIGVHYWYLFDCEVEGEPKSSSLKVKDIKWCTPEEMKTMKFEPAWEYWFKKIGVL